MPITSSSILRINLSIRQYRAPAHRFTNYKACWAPTIKREFTSGRMDRAKFSMGMNVEYKPVGGRNSNTSSSTGVIQRVLTEDGMAGSTSVNVKASEESPRYEIKNNKTGKTSAVKEENILKEASTP
ncbi:hypothetical protein DFH27DRAFT_610416 [Peziza echinospora]|nr:hypothetical protein DFH27DRAFT_610416 [Peziza echinospora]